MTDAAHPVPEHASDLERPGVEPSAPAPTSAPPPLPPDLAQASGAELVERFLTAFTDIEATVRGSGGAKESFAALAKKLFTARGLSRHLDTLGDFVDLRNLLAHGRHYPSGMVATPAPEVVAAIEALRGLVLAPPPALGLVKKDTVVTCAPTDQLDDVLPLIADLGFSQIPVYDDARCVGLLTHYALARWLAARWQRSEGVASESVAAVLEFAKPGEEAAFVSQAASVADVVALLTGSDQRARTSAVVVTADGSARQRPLGIATAGDLPRLVAALALPGR